MRAAIPLSILFGLIWNTIAVCLIGGRVEDSFRPSWLAAGVIAGIVAGWFTIWSRRRGDGEEHVRYGLATYYLGMLVYWASFVVLERVRLCVQHGGWTDFNLRDHLMLGVLMLVYGTLMYGVILVPLALLTRRLIWSAYCRYSR